MARQTVIGMFDDPSSAECAVSQLIDRGVNPNDISVIANDAQGKLKRSRGADRSNAGASGAASGTATSGSRSGNRPEDSTSAGGGASGGGAGAGTGAADASAKTSDDKATGTAVGAAVGAGIGALLGLGWLIVPGIGPVMTAGHIAAALGIGALAGAATGSLIGALVDMGIPEDDAGLYAEGVRRGGTLVGVSADEALVPAVILILDENGAVNPRDRSSQWQQSGWKRFDQSAAPMTPEQIAAERARSSPGLATDAQASAGAGGSAPGATGASQSGAPRSAAPTSSRGESNPATSGTSPDDEPEVIVVEEEVILAAPPIPGGGARSYAGGFGAAGQTGVPGASGQRGATAGRAGGSSSEVAPDTFGEELARDQRFRGRDWASAEPEARRSFEQRYPGSRWEQVKEAVSRGCEKIRQKL